MSILDNFFTDEPISAPKQPHNAANRSTELPNTAPSSAVDKMRLCIELLNDISSWTTSAARKPLEDTITQLTAMLTSVGGN